LSFLHPEFRSLFASADRQSYEVAASLTYLLMSAGSVKTDKFPVVVTSYEIVIADSKHLARYHWNYIVVDEGHRLKNFNCKLLRELRTIPTNNKLLLSGMPHVL